MRVCQTQVKDTKEYGKTLTAANRRFVGYLSDFQEVYKTKTKSSFDKALKYSQGILLSNRRNIEQICDNLKDSDYYQMQHFISDSPWKSQEVMDLTASFINQALPSKKLTGLLVDEVGQVKKGNYSVGVGWQYCGNVGKTANSQVSVLGCLSNGDFSSIVDARLYLPKEWCEDSERCKKAGIPVEQREFKTKMELAYEIIEHQHNNDIKFDFVSADGLYGNDTNFANKVDSLGYVYMLDIHSNQTIYLDKPELKVPEKKGIKGRRPTLAKPTAESINVIDYAKGLHFKQWQKVNVRNTAKGTLSAYYHVTKVSIWNKSANEIENRLLLIRKIKTKKGVELKFSFSNANLEQYTIKALAYMQAQRFFIEHTIKECKQVLGMSQFQTRKFIAWQHQTALIIMILGFMLKEKLLFCKDLPLLSARDLKDWLCFLFYEELTQEDVLFMIYNRHLRRQKDINYAYIDYEPNLSK